MKNIIRINVLNALSSLKSSLLLRCAASLILLNWLLPGNTPVFAAELVRADDQINVQVLSDSAPGITQQEIQTRIDDFFNCIKTQIYPALPPDIAILLRAHPMKIYFTEAGSGSEFFTPDPTNPANLVIVIKLSLIKLETSKSLLVHAYFHAIQSLIHPDPDQAVQVTENWLREGMADLFEFIVFFKDDSTENHRRAALMGLNTSLTGIYPDYNMPGDWAENAQLISEQYGHDLLYFHYLFDQCGDQSIFWKIARGYPDTYGERVVEKALKSQLLENPALAKKPQCLTFENSATSFELARIMNEVSLSDENDSQYFLATTGIKLPQAIDSLDRAIPLLKRTGRYLPTVVASSVVIPKELIVNKKVFWLKLTQPIQVQTTPPSSQNHWVQVFLNK